MQSEQKLYRFINQLDIRMSLSDNSPEEPSHIDRALKVKKKC